MISVPVFARSSHYADMAATSRTATGVSGWPMRRSPMSPFSDGESSFHVLWEDAERVFCRRWRNDADGNRNAVLAVLPAAEHPSPGSLNRLAHEYELRNELDGAWAVRPLELVRDRGRTMLVLEDPGGEPLDRHLGPPMETGKFLRLAVALSAAL